MVELRDEATRITVRVADSGIGIPPEALEKIFLPFYYVDTARRGTSPGSGLGLTIARHSIEAHGGQHSVRSALAQGSVFAIVISR